MRRFHWKRYAAVTTAVVLLLVLIIATSPWWLDLNRFREPISVRLAGVLGGTVHIGAVNWSFSNGIRLGIENISIEKSPSLPCDITVSAMRISIAVLPLISKKFIIKELALESPEVRWRTATRKGVPPPTSPEAPPQTSSPPVVEIDHFSITGGRLVLMETFSRSDRITTHRFTNIDVTANDLRPDREAKFTAAFQDENRPGMGQFTAQGRFRGLTESFGIRDPEMSVSATLTALDLSAVTPYLRSNRLKEALGGPVSLTVDYKGNLSGEFILKGHADLSGVTYTNTELWETPVGIADSRVDFHLASDADGFSLKKFSAVAGDNRVQLSARFENARSGLLIKDPLISGEFDLKSVSPLMPWIALGDAAKPWRQILDAGGRILADRIALPDIDTARPPTGFAELCENTEAHIRIKEVSLPALGPVPRIEEMSGRAHWKAGIAHIEALSGRLAGIAVPGVSGTVSRLFEKPLIRAMLRGRLTIERITDEQALRLIHRAGVADLNGDADLDLSLLLDTARPADYELDGEIKLDHFTITPLEFGAVVKALDAEALLTPQALEIHRLSADVIMPSLAVGKEERFSLKLKARLDDWGKEPQITLEHISTSPIPLRSLERTIPWPRLGDAADFIQRAMAGGGTLSIDTLALPPITLKTPPRQWTQWISRANAAVRFNALHLQPHPLSPPLSDIGGAMTLKEGVLTAGNITAKSGPVTFPRLDLRAAGFGERLRFEATATGPLTVEATDNAAVEKTLQKYGLSHLAGSADIHMRVSFDEKNAEPWTMEGRLSLADVNAKTYPDGVWLEDLRGTIWGDQSDGLNITVSDLTARLNNAPLRLAGKLTNGGTPRMALTGGAYVEKLNLADLSALIPPMKKMDLAGTLEMDVSAEYNAMNPAAGRLFGKVKTRRVAVTPPPGHLHITSGDADLSFNGDSVRINRLSLEMNGQSLTIDGDASNPKSPRVNLSITTDDLDLDRLLPPLEYKESPAAPENKERNVLPATASPEKNKTHRPPPWTRDLKLNVTLAAKNGRFRDREFKDLAVEGRYENSTIHADVLQVSAAGGRIAASGSATIFDPNQFSFEIAPDIQDVQTTPFMELLGMEKTAIRGPLTIKGNMSGRINGAKSVLETLRGGLDISVGNGTITNVGPLGQIFAKILSLTSIRGIISGQLFNNLTSEGIPFRHIQSKLAIDAGRIDLTDFLFHSDSLDITAAGNVDLVEKKLDIDAALVPFSTLDNVLGIIPLLGKAAGNLTKIYFDIKGPLDDPMVSLRLVRGVTEGIRELFRVPDGK